jgi:E3 ubiquitin-protein ligase RFWD3
MSDQEEEEHDFQAPVNIPTDVFTRKRRRSIDDNDNYVETEKDRVEASLCTLCQNFWTNNGPHAIVNLRCGHVFGKSCIDQHIRESTMKTSIARCPVCE